MSIERRFDVSLIAEMALREKQIQQNYRPIIGVHPVSRIDDRIQWNLAWRTALPPRDRDAAPASSRQESTKPCNRALRKVTHRIGR